MIQYAGTATHLSYPILPSCARFTDISNRMSDCSTVSSILVYVWGVIAAYAVPKDIHTLGQTCSFFHVQQTPGNKKVCTILLCKSLLASLERIYRVFQIEGHD